MSGVILNENFVDTAGLALTSHTSDGGETWTKHPSYSNSPVISDANRCRSSNVGSGQAYSSRVPGSAEYDGVFVFRCVSMSGPITTLVSRMDTSVDTGYQFGYDVTNANWRIRKVVSGTVTTLGSFAQTLTAGNDYSGVAVTRNGSQQLYVGGTQIIATTDTSITAAGRPGVRFSASGSNTAGVHIDSVVFTDANQTAGESGAGTDAASVSADTSAAGESGAGSEGQSASVQASASETGAGADSVSVSTQASASESGAGSDAVSVSTQASASESGAGADALAIDASAQVAETGAGTDAASASASVQASESGAGSDGASSSAQASAGESGAGTDAASAITPGSGSAGETGAGSEGQGASVQASASESGAGSENLSTSADVQAGESGAGTDAVSVEFGPTNVSADESGAGSESVSVAVKVSTPGRIWIEAKPVGFITISITPNFPRYISHEKVN